MAMAAPVCSSRSRGEVRAFSFPRGILTAQDFAHAPGQSRIDEARKARLRTLISPPRIRRARLLRGGFPRSHVKTKRLLNSLTLALKRNEMPPATVAAWLWAALGAAATC